MTLFEPTVDIESVPGRGATHVEVYVDGVHLGSVTGGGHLDWEARHPGYQALARRFASKGECVAWLVSGSPLPAGLCHELRRFHPHIHCTKQDGHSRRHEYAEPLSSMGRDQRRAERWARRAAA